MSKASLYCGSLDLTSAQLRIARPADRGETQNPGHRITLLIHLCKKSLVFFSRVSVFNASHLASECFRDESVRGSKG